MRERNGLCYSISSSYQLFTETGVFAISGGFDSQRAEAALTLTAKELRKIMDKKISPAELKRTKDYLLGTFRLGLEGTGNQMLLLGESVLNFGRVIRPDETIAGIQSVTVADIQQLANDIFNPTRLTLALVTPTHQPQTQEKWLQTFSVL